VVRAEFPINRINDGFFRSIYRMWMTEFYVTLAFITVYLFKSYKASVEKSEPQGALENATLASTNSVLNLKLNMVDY
jgi:Ca2+/Na+ antiporter